MAGLWLVIREGNLEGIADSSEVERVIDECNRAPFITTLTRSEIRIWQADNVANTLVFERL